MRQTLAVCAAAALLLSLTACMTGGEMPNESPSRTPFETSSPGAIAPSGTPIDVSQQAWDAIVADLAQRGVSAEPELVSAEAVTWNNGALGCPKPGMNYTQALVEGMRVVVTAGGETYDYRFGSEGSPVLCEA
ncbi:hypothetical protein [Homoserinimonas hongtaonis]|uniref:PASTA domain-containing protein n=1 Tax=Homoserinimonas hongtaonis TaxID=2079791 RepID=A0A2U1T2Y8_9MICO|nr:hypothetical protein [Salinibacterium hongtaonis]PWB98227.1 hypothetical protein DF220_10600 [Salinibacterium hongtaonis]